MYFYDLGLVCIVGVLWLEVPMSHIMAAVFSHHVMVQLEVKCSLVHLCQGNSNNLVEMTNPLPNSQVNTDANKGHVHKTIP